MPKQKQNDIDKRETKKNSYSIVIRVRNAEKDLELCLAALEQQILPNNGFLELIVVDNASEDHSVHVARSFGAKIVQITQEEFSWGRALNWGIAEATNDIVLLLSSDAHPANEQWLIEMVTPFQNENITAVYGRQIPKKDAPLDEIVRLQRYFPSHSILFKGPMDKRECEDVIASNACAALRCDIWRQFPFDESVNGAEERPWVNQILTTGHTIQYTAEASVFHSHKDTLLRNACRLIELWDEEYKRKNKRFHIHLFTRGLAVFAKRRITNICYPRVNFLKRIEGAFRLFPEIMALTIMFFTHRTGIFQKIRAKAWR